MTQATQTTPYARGRQAGLQAFQEGRVAVPCLDPAMRAYGREEGAELLPWLTGWTEAWHQANAEDPWDV